MMGRRQYSSFVRKAAPGRTIAERMVADGVLPLECPGPESRRNSSRLVAPDSGGYVVLSRVLERPARSDPVEGSY